MERCHKTNETEKIEKAPKAYMRFWSFFMGGQRYLNVTI